MEINQINWGYSLFSTLVLLADFFIRITLSVRVIMRKRPYGVSFAWLIVILLVPFIGGGAYLLFGENRLPEKRMARAKVSYKTYMSWLQNLKTRAPVSWHSLNPTCMPLQRQAETLVGIPAMSGNKLTLITNPNNIITSITHSIDNAHTSCHLQFYIWEEGGNVEQVAQALIRAAGRGVTCRILLDSIGSRKFLKSEKAKQMRNAGIKIEESLPAGIINVFFSRIDIRNHRKIVVIDGEVAYTGSQNMVDPEVFKLDSGVGKWIDVMVKAEGPVVESLAGTFISDWFLETEETALNSELLLKDIDSVRQAGDMHPCPMVGQSAVQLVPSGPGFVPEAIHHLLLTTIYGARKELILTTPYFIPDEPLLAALKAAAQRGVDVKIILPRDNDSVLVKYASRARYEDLAASGVSIYLFYGGLLHSKSVTVDGDLSLFGSVNLDMRSFWLNFEATLFIYCRTFTRELKSIQQGYLAESTLLDLKQFRQRTKVEKFKENLLLLISPLL
ncbi:cardiolipin synthase [Desulforhopalus singaporensis]|uniref:Cardiolipin synthase n=1 Tax=Desulforhopalus singaporensis TaxID=91360 RepID=A0A1H0MRI2_9BACT|nr:cardiolipin synthase [Desulforhopalus singaporensis]SDO83002.1 cardiolipin synthetase 2 [Desulforhopalus singaporensis]